jgi:hypothetical protein
MGRTFVANPAFSSRFGTYPESQVARDQSTSDFIMRTDRSSARMIPRTAHPSLDAPVLDPTKVSDARPTLLNRPRKLSSSSTVSSVSISKESFDSRFRSPAWGSAVSSARTSFESMDTSSNPWRPEYLYQRPPTIKTFRKKARPGELFSMLPGEVLELILDELKKLHLAPGCESCSTCWMRDLCSIYLSSRKWAKFARTAL